MPVNSIMSFTDTLAKLNISSGDSLQGSALDEKYRFCGPNKPTKVTTSPGLGSGGRRSETQENWTDSYSSSMCHAL